MDSVGLHFMLKFDSKVMQARKVCIKYILRSWTACIRNLGQVINIFDRLYPPQHDTILNCVNDEMVFNIVIDMIIITTKVFLCLIYCSMDCAYTAIWLIRSFLGPYMQIKLYFLSALAYSAQLLKWHTVEYRAFHFLRSHTRLKNVKMNHYQISRNQLHVNL